MKRENLKFISAAVDKWLKYQSLKTAHSTYVNYKSKANIVKGNIGERLISKTKTTDIRDFIFELSESYCNKTINEILIVLRGAFNYATEAKIIKNSPMNNINNLPIADPRPISFELNEISAILAVQTTDVNGKNLFALGINTGLRISELLALMWSDIDLSNGWLTVKRSNVIGRYKTPKTSASYRKLKLNRHSIAVLKQQFSVTGHLPNVTIKCTLDDNRSQETITGNFLFINEKTGNPFKSVAEFREQFFRPLCTSAHVPFKGATTIRHTFASHAVKAGASDFWVAKQLGHTSTKTIRKHYLADLESDEPTQLNKLTDYYQKIEYWSNGAPYKHQDESDIDSRLDLLYELQQVIENHGKLKTNNQHIHF